MKRLAIILALLLLSLPVCAQQMVSQAQQARTTGTITTSSSSIPVATVGYSVATVTVNGTYAGITVNFEFSDDGGTTWYSDTCTRTDTNVQESSEALPSNQSRAWDCGVFAATNFRVRSSAFTSGTANIGITLSAASIEPAQTVSVSGNIPAVGTLSDNNAVPAATNNLADMPCVGRADLRGGTATTAGRLVFLDCGTDGNLHVTSLPDLSLKRYRASSKFAASSTTDNWRINGNASNTVIVTKLSVTCTETTAGQVSVQLIKRSTAGSGGTAASVTAVPLDSNKAAASSVVNSYTGTGPTVGTAVGDLDDAQFGCMASGTATPNDIYIPAISPGAPLAVLRGTAEGLALNFGGAITGGNLTVSVEWSEVTTITP
jgi:hypothetical protein